MTLPLLMLIFLFSPLLVFSQYKHPYAEELDDGRRVYYLNAQEKAVPATADYTYKRVASKSKKDPWQLEDFYDNGKLYRKALAADPEPIHNTELRVLFSLNRSGDTLEVQEFKKGKREGKHRAYFAKNKPKVTGQYENDKRVGAWKTFYETGKIKEEGIYDDGHRTGKWTFYDQKGKKQKEGAYFNGKEKGEWKLYFEDGTVKEAHMYINPGTIQLRKTFHRNGAEKLLEGYSDGVLWGTSVELHPNGKPYAVRYYEEGKLHGPITFFTDAGDTLATGAFLENNPDGTWRFWNSDLQLVRVETFHEGELVRGSEWSESGALKMQMARLENGEINAQCFDESNEPKLCDFEIRFPQGDANSIASKLDSNLAQYFKARCVVNVEVKDQGQTGDVSIIESADTYLDGVVAEILRDYRWKMDYCDNEECSFYNEVLVNFSDDGKSTVAFGTFYQKQADVNPIWAYRYGASLVEPHYPGGFPRLSGFLKEETSYPLEAKENDIKGTSLIQFRINPSGIISNVEVVNPTAPILDYEAIRVTESMPIWNPKLVDGNPVSSTYVLPFSFLLK